MSTAASKALPMMIIAINLFIVILICWAYLGNFLISDSLSYRCVSTNATDLLYLSQYYDHIYNISKFLPVFNEEFCGTR